MTISAAEALQMPCINLIIIIIVIISSSSSIIMLQQSYLPARCALVTGKNRLFLIVF